jgi:hypothetical protein
MSCVDGDESIEGGDAMTDGGKNTSRLILFGGDANAAGGILLGLKPLLTARLAEKYL